MKKNIFSQEYLYLKSQKEVSEIIDLICTKGAEILYDKYLVDKWAEYLGEDIMHWNDGIISQKQIITDKGESKIVLQHKWIPEPEPVPLQIDNSARSAIRTEVKTINEAQENEDETKSIRSNTSFGGSVRQHSITSSRFSKASFLANQSSKFKNSLLLQKSNLSQMTNDGEKSAKSGRASKPPSLHEPDYELIRTAEESEPPTPDPITDKLRENREKKDKEKVIKQKQQQKKDEEDMIFKERQRDLQKQLKHKNVTYDIDGSLIFIKQKQNYSSGNEVQVPQDGFGLEFKNPNKKLGEVQRQPNIQENEITKPVNLMNEFKKEKNKKKETAPPPTLEFHKQPNLVEFLNVKTGVNVTFQNGIKKEGGVIEYNNKMRREEYEKIIENQPNRPIPQYLQQQQLLEVPQPMSELQKKLKSNLKSSKRPATAGSYQMQKIQIQEQDLYMDMMADELPQVKQSQMLSRLYGTKSLRVSQSNLQQSQLKSMQQETQKEKKKRPLTSTSINKIQQYKKKQIGLRGEEFVSYDIGFEYGKQQDMSKIQEESNEYNDNIAKIHKKVEKFDEEIRQNKQWGQVEIEPEFNNKKKLKPTSYQQVKKPSSATLTSSQSTRHFPTQKLFTSHNKQLSNSQIPSIYANNSTQFNNLMKVKPQSGKKPTSPTSKQEQFKRVQSAKQ